MVKVRILSVFLLGTAACTATAPNSREREQEERIAAASAPQSAPSPAEPQTPQTPEETPSPTPPPAESTPLPQVTGPAYSALKLLPEGRHLLTTNEPLPLKVIATRADGTEEDVTETASFTVRNGAVGSVVSGRFVPTKKGSQSTIITASLGALSAPPVLVSTVSPRVRRDFEASEPFTLVGAAPSIDLSAPLAGNGSLRIAFSGKAGDSFSLSFTLPAPLSLTNVERVRFLARLDSDVDLAVRLGITAGGVSTDSPGSGLVAHRSDGQVSFESGVANVDKSYEASSIRLTFTLNAAGNGAVVLDEIELVQQFVLGLNLAWLDGSYAHDFGKSFHHPDWGVAYDPAHVDALLAMMQGLGIRLLRVWVFESCEGLQKDAAERVTGIEPTFWQNFDDFVFTRLPKYDVKVTFMLLGAHHTHECSSPSPVSDPTARRAFFDQAMLPFVARYGVSPWVWSIDLANEPEGAVAGSSGNWTTGVTWTQMRSYLSEGAAAVKTVAPRAFVSAGSGWHAQENVAAGQFSGLGFTHLDFHNYSDSGALATYASLQRHARVIVGEGGQESETRDLAVQKSALSTMLGKAYSGSYWGFWPWAIEAPGVSNQFTLIDPTSTYSALETTPALEALGAFVGSHSDIGP